MAPKRPFWLWAMIRQRCPRCRLAPLFHGLFAMHETCPLCGLRFQRDQGYFLGAMYVSYPISAVLICAMLWLGSLLLPEWHLNWVLFAVVLPLFLPMVPLVFRYSRTLWIWFDHGADPTGAVDLHGWEQWCAIWDERHSTGAGKPS
jgi:uncharacterized protein (DUF983 family)